LASLTILKELKKHEGINDKKALNIIIYLGLNPNNLYKSIPKNKLITLFKVINYLKDEASIDTSLRNKIKSNINAKIKINSFAGKRHRLGYPVKGQRTRSNARTAKKLNRFRSN
jgi:small subunit ribosomal protein S13